jgi:hypothetical protein
MKKTIRRFLLRRGIKRGRSMRKANLLETSLEELCVDKRSSKGGVLRHITKPFFRTYGQKRR